MGIFSRKNKRLPEWQLSLSPQEQKRRKAEERQMKRGAPQQTATHASATAAPVRTSDVRSRGAESARVRTSADARRRTSEGARRRTTDRSSSNDRRNSTGAGGFLRDSAIAFVWGFADATVLPIGPEVWTTNLAIRNRVRGGAVTWGALAGSLAGGVVTYQAAQEAGRKETGQRMLRLPDVAAGDLTAVRTEVEKYGAGALASGAVEATPYKAYAAALGAHEAPMGEFLFWSAVNRMTRVGMLTFAAGAVGTVARTAAPRLTRALGPLALNAGWAAYYSWRLSGRRR